jgi:peptidyl-Asp metalloendopeptidase
MRRKALAIGVLVFLAFTALSQAGDPEEVRPLLRLVEGRFWRSADLPGTVAERAVSLDATVLNAARVRLPLLDGQTYELVRTGVELQGKDGLAWRGKVLDPAGGEEAYGSVTLTVKDGTVLGRISVPGASYQIAQAADGSYRLAEVDDTRLDRCAVRSLGGGFSHEVSQLADAVEVPLRSDLAKKKPPKAPPTTTLRLLVLYTDEAEHQLLGAQKLEEWVQGDVNLGNSAFQNSGVPVQVELVGTRKFAYTETSEPYTDLTFLRMSNDVDNLRREYGATHVILLVARMTDACGIGDLMRKDKYLDPTRPFQGSAVVRASCMGGFTLIHEIGHTLGCEHDPDWGSPVQFALYPQAYGHFVDGNFRTVMSYPYSCSNGCPTAPYFSNPSVRFGGVPTGIRGRRDNSSVISVTRTKLSGPPDEGCVPGPITMCLAGGRIKAELEFFNPNTTQLGFAKVRMGTDTTGYFGYGDAANPAVALRMEPDGSRVRVSYGQLSDFPFELTISDLQTGRVSQYYDTENACGATIANAFAASASAAAQTGRARGGRGGGCKTTGDTLCLHNRFAVTVDWKRAGSEGRAEVSTVSGLAGAFDFGDGGDPELVMKITPNGKKNFDISYGTLSNQQYTLTITDTSTKTVRTYENPAGSYCGGREIPAF